MRLILGRVMLLGRPQPHLMSTDAVESSVNMRKGQSTLPIGFQT